MSRGLGDVYKRQVYELVLEHNILSKEDLDTILKPENMIKPVKLDIHPNH